jgi:type IV secretion system protein TrbL
VGNNVFQSLKMPAGSTVTIYQAFCIALAAILLMVLSMVASRLATDLIIGGPSLGVGTAVNQMAVAYNTSVGAATSRPAVIAVKAASVVPTKGAAAVGWAGKAVYGGARRLMGAGAATTASAVPAAGSKSSPSSTGLASRLPGPKTPPGGKGNSTGGSVA